jgi:hypothetical protein
MTFESERDGLLDAIKAGEGAAPGDGLLPSLSGV